MAVVSEYVRALPAAPLLPYVGWYSGYRQEGLEPARHRGLPSPYLTLIITLDEVPDALELARHSAGPPRIVVHPNGEMT